MVTRRRQAGDSSVQREGGGAAMIEKDLSGEQGAAAASKEDRLHQHSLASSSPTNQAGANEKTKTNASPDQRGTVDLKEVSGIVRKTYPPMRGEHVGNYLLRISIENFNEFLWDLLYVGYWILTPFIGGLPPITKGDKAPVVIVPGFCGRPRPFKAMRDRIAAAGHPVYVFESGYNMGSIVNKSMELSALLAKYDLKDVIIVGHSMGGLVAAEAMTRGESRIKRMVAVGVPFHGAHLTIPGLMLFVYLFASIENTWISLVLLIILLSIPATRQMLPGSDFLSMLSPRYPLIADHVTCIYTPTDWVLLRAASALIIQNEEVMDRAVLCHTLGHAHLLFGNEAHDLIVEQLGLGFNDPTDWPTASGATRPASSNALNSLAAAAAAVENVGARGGGRGSRNDIVGARDAPSPT